MNLQDNLGRVLTAQHISQKQTLNFIGLFNPLVSWYHPLQFNPITHDKAHPTICVKRSHFLQNKSPLHL